ncbi:HlyD family secretion protein [Desulfonispora thiosulfatigenes DSM 11270]|uniref:HlyD family secretion protein n=1 Tax=Desulfonispora thiosulfatigenes DSM 11270 TaxID=656914 RepID=A0A1W1UEZ9_DESTI|nr:efflux RND transporter periplasmic adaptor subunit [Desulfonispora thiosulfatigenes]SMB79603.1 HlyD family secretion protein [Desulfonispora thiosulfatigenes DSM 11270]
MKNKRILVLSALVIVVSLFTACSTLATLTGDKIVKKENDHLIVQSNVEMTDTNINSQTGGKIKEINVKEGDSVKQGQVLITIDSDSLAAQRAQILAQMGTIKAQLNSAIAGRDAALAQLQKAQNGARPEEINQAKSAYELAQIKYEREKMLYEEDAISKADLDNVYSQYEIAKNKYELIRNGTRPEDIAASQAQVNQANASIEVVQGQLKQAEASLQGLQVNVNNTIITAPTDGVVTQINAEPGELVSMGMPLVVITNTNNPSIQCNLKETDLSKVKLGQEVSISIPSFPDKNFIGKIVKINKNADFAVKRATNDNGEFDILSYGVKVELLDMNQPLYAGMTAFVDFGKVK